jgi:hypothetical protein
MKKRNRKSIEEIQQAMNSLRMGSLRNSEYGDPMQRLWIAVILQATLDLFTTSDKIREDAEEFFNGETLEYMCENTGLDYLAVLRHVKNLMRTIHE